MRTSDFERIYGEYYPAVYRYALSLARDLHMAEDLAQETFAKALLSLDEGKNIVAWLHVVCRHLWIDQCRRDKKIRLMSREEMENETKGESPEDMAPSAGLLRKTALLPPAMREAILLYYHSGLNCAEIAGVQHTTPGAVRTLLYRARIQLKKLWEDDRDEIQ